MSLLMMLIAAAPIYGIATGGDGDFFQLGSQRVRLFGIDAPEWGQTCERSGQSWPCGQEAAEALSKMIVGKDVRCVPTGTDQFDRLLARCTVGGLDVNRALVASGYAVAFRRYSSEYVSAEETAKANRRGIWAGTFEMPSDVRHAAATPEAPRRERQARRGATRQVRSSPGHSGGCNIKGNHSRRGPWIYHLPGMPYYAQTRAEQMFCSEAEARAAGYRRAIVK